LLEVPEEGQVIIDSEDMASAFNLFKMPEGWRGMFVYEKKVPARVLGGDSDEPVFVALRTIPMGWLSAVGVVQFAIRHLAFEIAKLPKEDEIQKWKEIPRGQKLLLYLDSVDQLRLVSSTMAEVMKGESSPEHQRFSDACDKKGLPRNASKALAGALVGSLQGGELRSKEGVFMLHPEKMRMDVALCLYVLTMTKWKRRETSGLVGRLIFAGAFRRPLLSSLEEIFVMFQKTTNGKVPSSRVIWSRPPFTESRTHCILMLTDFRMLQVAIDRTCPSATSSGAINLISCGHQLSHLLPANAASEVIRVWQAHRPFQLLCYTRPCPGRRCICRVEIWANLCPDIGKTQRKKEQHRYHLINRLT